MPLGQQHDAILSFLTDRLTRGFVSSPSAAPPAFLRARFNDAYVATPGSCEVRLSRESRISRIRPLTRESADQHERARVRVRARTNAVSYVNTHSPSPSTSFDTHTHTQPLALALALALPLPLALPSSGRSRAARRDWRDGGEPGRQGPVAVCDESHDAS